MNMYLCLQANDKHEIIPFFLVLLCYEDASMENFPHETSKLEITGIMLLLYNFLDSNLLNFLSFTIGPYSVCNSRYSSIQLIR